MVAQPSVQPKSTLPPSAPPKKVFKYEELPESAMKPSLNIDLGTIDIPADSGQLADFGDVIEPRMADEKKAKKTDVSSDELKDYIEKRMAAKLGSLQDELNGMIDNFQLEIIRQFQI